MAIWTEICEECLVESALQRGGPRLQPPCMKNRRLEGDLGLLSCSSLPDAGAGDSSRHRVLRAEPPVWRPQPAEGGPRHREHPAGQTGPRQTLPARYRVHETCNGSEPGKIMLKELHSARQILLN